MAELRVPSDFADLSRQDTVGLSIVAGTGPEDLQFQLQTHPTVTWWKAIELRSATDALIAFSETQDADHGPHIRSAPAADLVGARMVLAKAKIFGAHAGMYELRNLSVYRGRRFEFIWLRDDDQDGPLVGFFRDVGEGIAGAADAVAGAIVVVINFIAAALVAIIQTIGRIIVAILDAVGALLGSLPLIGPWLRALFNWLGTVVSAAFDFVATAVGAVLNIVANIVGGLIRMVVGGIGGLIAGDGRVFVRGFGDLVAGIFGGVVAILGKALALIQSVLFMQLGERALTQLEEALLQRIYRSSLALANIRVVEGFAGFYSAGPSFTLGNRIYLQNVVPGTELQILVHESVHVWQNQHEGTRYIADSLWARTDSMAYAWRDQLARGRSRWQDFNVEAQGKFIQELYVLGLRGPSTGIDGEFFDDDPIGPDAYFIDVDTGDDLTGLAREAMFYIRRA